jgi:hypothetical protein
VDRFVRMRDGRGCVHAPEYSRKDRAIASACTMAAASAAGLGVNADQARVERCSTSMAATGSAICW